MLPTITLKNFQSFRTHQRNWSNIPIEYLNVFRTLVPASQYKYNFKGYDPKGRPSYLKLYAKTFSVSFRASQVEFYAAKRQTKNAIRMAKALMAMHGIELADIA